MHITGDMIWLALSADPKFLRQPDAVRLFWKEFCRVAVPAMEPLLDLPVTAESCVQAYHAITTLLIEDGWARKLGEAYPDTSPEKVGKLVETYTRLHQRCDSAVKEDLDFLREDNSEEGLVGYTMGLLSAGSLARWRKGEFTIRELLTSQPGAVFGICLC